MVSGGKDFSYHSVPR